VLAPTLPTQQKPPPVPAKFKMPDLLAPPAAATAAASSSPIRRVALAGNPNAGKTTVFNALTGLRQKVANYPGITVEKKTGRARLADGTWLEVLDLPGTYSLEPQSPDEAIAATILRDQREDTPAPDVVIAVVDASNLARNLFLVSQLLELGLPIVVALNMMDVAERQGLTVDPVALSEALHLPVIPIIGHQGKGIDALKTAIATASAVPPLPAWNLPEALWEELHRLTPILLEHAPGAFPETPVDPSRTAPVFIAARRLLAAETGPLLKKLHENPHISAALEASLERLAALKIDPMQADIVARYGWIDTLVTAAVVTTPVAPGARAQKRWSERLDAVLLHPIAGLAIFAVVMAGVFVTIFTIAGPLNDAFSDAISWLGAVGFSGLDGGPLRSLLLDGIVAGVASVVVFVPQIALLFLCLGILEDSGYLARAAFLMDRLLAKVGLHGKSFIPLLSSFACAIPGIMATRTIDSRRERLGTILVAPFMSCSARLPVYALLIGAFFASAGPLVQGGLLLGCYALGIAAAAVVAWAFGLRARRRGERGSTFILELPTYKRPQASLVAWQVWNGCKAFLTKAGTTIFCLTVLIWAACTYPGAPDAARTTAADQAEQFVRTAATAETQPDEVDAAIATARTNAEAQTDLEHSIAGRLGHLIEPAIEPLGFDWKIGVGLVGAFAAREVFNSTLAVIYNLGARDADDITDLSTAIRTDRRADGTLIWRPLTAVSLLVWFVLAMQCISTTAVVRRETGGWTWPMIQLVGMNIMAYIASLIVFQGGRWLGY